MSLRIGFGLMLLAALAWPQAGRAQQAMSHHHHAMHDMPMPAASNMPPPAMPDMPDMSHPPKASPMMQHMPMHHPHTPTSGSEPRSADYSDGLRYGPMTGMDMLDDKPLAMWRFDQLEAFHGRHENGQRWDLTAWYGGDLDKLWLRSEGERSQGRLEDGDVELLWNHALTAFWNTQLGVRHDVGEGPARSWAAFGIEGLAPYFLEVSATLYAGPSGRSAARLRVEYEWLFTQCLILQPELELNAYGKSDPRRDIGAGLSDASLGLRLRYEIRRRFAPYVGIRWSRRFGDTASMARARHGSVFDHTWVAGLRWWF